MEPKDEIKQKLDVVELVGEYLDLKPAGGGSFKTLCPFHGEKTPSFYVSGEKQIWHCFGCGEGGDCFSFVMKMEGMDFGEALRHLGKKTGVEVRRYSSVEGNERTRLLSINELAAKFFQKVLQDAPGAAAAREYLARRGMTPDLIEKFGIGFALDSWDTLATFLAKRGYQGTEGERAGLLLRKKSGQGFIDRFRARVMIPLRDQHGNTVGFTGRVLPTATPPSPPLVKGGDQGPKYMNSPETPVYHKGQLLYGLDLAKRAIKENSCVIVVEGNLDVVASHKAGVENVVASSGTALTKDQLTLLKRFTDTIVFSFDADAAGFAAARRGMKEARALGFDLRAIVLPKEAGKDPDEAVQKDPLLWIGAVAHTRPIMEYLIEQTIKGRDLGNVDDKKQVAALLIPALEEIANTVEREHWLQQVAALLRTDVAVLRSSLKLSLASPQPLKPHQAPLAPVAPLAPTSQPKQSQAADLLLGIIIQNPSHAEFVFAGLKDIVLPTTQAQIIYKHLCVEYDSGQLNVPASQSLFARLRTDLEAQPDTAPLVSYIGGICLKAEEYLASLTEKQTPEHIKQLISVLTDASLTQERKRLLAEVRAAEARADHAEVDRLLRVYQDLF